MEARPAVTAMPGRRDEDTLGDAAAERDLGAVNRNEDGTAEGAAGDEGNRVANVNPQTLQPCAEERTALDG